MLNLDLERLGRRGIGEVVYGPGKQPQQIAAALSGLARQNGYALASRVDKALAAAVRVHLPAACYHDRACMLSLGQPVAALAVRVGLVSAGTADQGVAAEAELCLSFLGLSVTRIDDCGIAGLQRLLAVVDVLRTLDMVIVCAGMDGALPAVVAGLLSCPVIGVPTSVGYGVAAGGRAALMTMLSSCTDGLAVVNIDGGVQAASLCRLIAQVALRHKGDRDALAPR